MPIRASAIHTKSSNERSDTQRPRPGVSHCSTRSHKLAPAPTIHIPRIDSPPTLADFEDMHPSARVAEHMVKISGFIAREPSDGARPTQDTDVYLAYDEKNLYAAFICWDNEPGKIRARMARREDTFPTTRQKL